MKHPISIQNDGGLLLVYCIAIAILIGTLLFAVQVKRIGRKKNIL